VIAEGVETELEDAGLASQGIHPYRVISLQSRGFESLP